MKLNKILILILFALLLLLNGFSLYYNRNNTSGFVFERLGFLITNLHNGNNILQGYTTFPSVPYFLSTIHYITGLDILDCVFLPIVPTLAIIPLLLLSKIFFHGKIAFFVPIPIFLTFFASIPHFIEYYMAKIMFLYFVYTFFKYLNGNGNTPLFAILSILFFIEINFFGPPMGVWAISLIFFFILSYFFLYGLRNVMENVNRYKTQLIYPIVLMTIFLLYNPKFYHGFLNVLQHGYFSPKIFLDSLKNFVAMITSLNPHRGRFLYTPTSPLPLRIANTLYTFFVIVPLAAIFIYQVIIKRRFIFKTKNIKDIFAISLLLPFIVDFTVYGLLGAISLRYALLIFPILGMYWIKKLHIKRIFIILLVFLILLSSCSFGLNNRYRDEIYHEMLSDTSVKSLVSYIDDKTEKGSEIMVDHHTYGIMKMFFGVVYKNPFYFKYVPYTTKRYEKLVNADELQPFDFQYIVIDLKNFDKAVFSNVADESGRLAWRQYAPIKMYYTEINSNQNINKIYQSQTFAIFSSISF